MKMLLFLLLFACGTNMVFSQILNRDSVNNYIKNLSWESVYINDYSSYASNNKLEIINGTGILVFDKDWQTVNKLYWEISDSTKTVAIHAILTKMFEPKNDKLRIELIYNKHRDSIIAVEQTYNKLIWQLDRRKVEYTIRPEAVQAIKEYWKQKIEAYYHTPPQVPWK